MKEYQLQKAVCKYLDLQGYLYCATMGGQYQKYHSQRNKAKATGYKKGIPDIIIYEPVKKYQSDEYWHGLALELKVGYNKPTEHQWFWINLLRKKEYIAEVCYDLDTAISIVETYMNGYIK
tara:strand:+ start:184 stop:546 length:363 start_codon:yes stop_codon:yes gene_type:complete